MPHRIFASKNHDGNIPVDGLWDYEDYGISQATEYVRADFNAALVELLKQLQPIAFITRHNELHRLIDEAIARAESAETDNDRQD